MSSPAFVHCRYIMLNNVSHTHALITVFCPFKIASMSAAAELRLVDAVLLLSSEPKSHSLISISKGAPRARVVFSNNISIAFSSFIMTHHPSVQAQRDFKIFFPVYVCYLAPILYNLFSFQPSSTDAVFAFESPTVWTAVLWLLLLTTYFFTNNLLLHCFGGTVRKRSSAARRDDLLRMYCMDSKCCVGTYKPFCFSKTKKHSLNFFLPLRSPSAEFCSHSQSIKG